jgi:hypothetical protein
MATPKDVWKGIDRGDRYMLLSSMIVPVLFWWFYIGRKKYGTKGMK